MKKGYTHQLGVNHFADWTDEEFKAILGMKGNAKSVRSEEVADLQDNDPIPEASFFWSKLGNEKGVHAVKDQSSCGSCWAFASVAAYENAYWQFTGEGDMLDFSEQQLVDCSFQTGNDGCKGGEFNYTYNYMKEYQMTVLQNYKYNANDGVCKYYTTFYRPGPKVFKYIEQLNTNENSLKNMLHNNVISVAVDAGNWRFYKSGVFDDKTCGEDINHGVALVGYDSKENYWLIKNSWGT